MITTDTLHLGDCLELMKDIPDNSVDMVLCDLPYGKVACKWDIIIPFEKLWPLYDRVCKENAAIVLFANEPFTSEMILSNIKQYRQKLTWLKTRPTNVFNAKKTVYELDGGYCRILQETPHVQPSILGRRKQPEGKSSKDARQESWNTLIIWGT